jgi:uncharacterized protein YbjT (DUF2867 family)
MDRNALVAGATGLVGNELVQLLIESGLYKAVHVITRRPYKFNHPLLFSHIVDFENLESFKLDIEIQDVYICLGTTIKKAGTKKNFSKVDHDYVISLARWARDNRAEKFAVISSMGADARSAFSFYLRVKGQLEQDLQALKFKNLIILRPSLLLGKRDEFRFGEKISELFFKPISSLMKGRLRKFRPVEAKNVAAAMIYFTRHSKSQVKIVENDEILNLKHVNYK